MSEERRYNTKVVYESVDIDNPKGTLWNWTRLPNEDRQNRRMNYATTKTKVHPEDYRRL